MRPYSPGGVLNTFAPSPNSKSPTTSTHRLRRGLPGYLILFAPHAFVPQRQYRPSQAPTPLVFLLISANFTSTLGILLTSTGFKTWSFKSSSGVEPRDFTSDFHVRLRSFKPSDSEQRLPHSYYRGCWHEFSRGFLYGYRHYLHH